MTELDCLPTIEYSRHLIHCLYFLLEPGLFTEVALYLDISIIPSVLARVCEKYIDDVPICLDVATVISTIAQSIFLMYHIHSRIFY